MWPAKHAAATQETCYSLAYAGRVACKWHTSVHWMMDYSASIPSPFVWTGSSTRYSASAHRLSSCSSPSSLKFN